MNLFSLISIAVFAAETVLSPIPDDGIAVPTPQPRPEVSFGQLLSYAPPQVLGATTEQAPTPNPTPKRLPTRKDTFTIAVLGDSMVDTLGPGVPHLAAELRAYYPGVSFQILNYGVGATNIEYGITRIMSDYDYLGNHIAALASTSPDLVVLESFAYNPLPVTDGVTRHWLDLARMVDTLRSSLPGSRLLIVSTIAPNASIFGDSILNWSPEEKQRKVTEIKEYLDSTIKFAQSQRIPAADVFHPSLGADGNGKLAYINPGDHIHYSDAGRELFARIVSNAIVSNKLLE